jgi:hypothetical protein
MTVQQFFVMQNPVRQFPHKDNNVSLLITLYYHVSYPGDITSYADCERQNWRIRIGKKEEC